MVRRSNEPDPIEAELRRRWLELYGRPAPNFLCRKLLARG